MNLKCMLRSHYEYQLKLCSRYLNIFINRKAQKLPQNQKLLVIFTSKGQFLWTTFSPMDYDWWLRSHPLTTFSLHISNKHGKIWTLILDKWVLTWLLLQRGKKKSLRKYGFISCNNDFTKRIHIIICRLSKSESWKI